jgi:hypothetical protein
MFASNGDMTPRTQNSNFEFERRLPFRRKLSTDLTYVAYGCVFIIDATRQRIPKSRAPQSRRNLLLCVDQLSDAVEQLAQDCSISQRQAYRYLEQAQSLKQPVPPNESKSGIYGETSTQPRAAREIVRWGKKIVHQRGCQLSVARAAAARVRALG